ncbi:MAG TPA: hypothetical protein VJ794_07005, partial [Gemmatimonadales bacterium]|nr:hypothetical protein [Gemmatimonadales bacterium]
MRRVAALIQTSALLSLALLPPADASAQSGASALDTTLVLRGGRYLDTRAGVLRPNGAIVVRDGRIIEIHPPPAPPKLPPGANSLDLAGRTILPGLIDAHVHL